MPNTRPCPFCAEQIQPAAVVCRHCGRDVPAVEPEIWPPFISPAEQVAAIKPDHRAWWRRRDTLILAAVLLVVIAFVVIAQLPKKAAPPPSPQYLADRSYCEGLATSSVNNSGGLYTVGGTHWVSLVNDCLVTRRIDEG